MNFGGSSWSQLFMVQDMNHVTGRSTKGYGKVRALGHEIIEQDSRIGARFVFSIFASVFMGAGLVGIRCEV